MGSFAPYIESITSSSSTCMEVISLVQGLFCSYKGIAFIQCPPPMREEPIMPSVRIGIAFEK
jgi:hypothetical protein